MSGRTALIVAVLVLIGIGVWRYRSGGPDAVVEPAPSTAAAPRETTPRVDAPTPPAAAAPAQSSPQPYAYDRWQRDVAAWAGSREDADSLTAAALLLRDVGERTLPFSVMRRAVVLAPADPGIAWVAALLCDDAYHCDSTPFERVLVDRDPANAMTRLGSLRAALRANDGIARLLAVSLMADAERVDTYTMRVHDLLDRAVERAPFARPEAPQEKATGKVPVLANGLTAALPEPDYGAVVMACSDARDSLLDACRRLARKMRKADAFGARRVGVILGKAVEAAGSAEEREVTETARELDWLNVQLSKVTQPQRQMSARIREQGGEYEGVRAFLQQAGLPVDPPLDWTP